MHALLDLLTYPVWMPISPRMLACPEDLVEKNVEGFTAKTHSVTVGIKGFGNATIRAQKV